jgi:hypothetical protein
MDGKSFFRRIFMKKIMAVLLMAALFAGVAFAGDRFSVRAKAEGDLFTTTAGSSGTTEGAFFKGLDAPHGDTQAEFSYDAESVWGGLVRFRLNNIDTATNVVNAPRAFAWVNFGGIVKVSAGKGIDYRAIEKVDGITDFGVNYVKTEDGSITTSDPFKFGSGLLANVIVGPINVGLFAGPSAGAKPLNTEKGTALTSAGSKELGGDTFYLYTDGDGNDYVSPIGGLTVIPEFETDPFWNGDLKAKDVKDFYNYQYGFSVFYGSDLADVGAVLRLSRAGTESAGGIVDSFAPPGTWDDTTPITPATLVATADGSYGALVTDFGLYGKIKAIDGLVIGVGYAGNYAYPDKEKDATKHVPFKSGINLDAKYTGIDKLTIGLYNNLSFWTQTAESPIKDTSYLNILDRLDVAYALNDKLTVDARVQNVNGGTTYDGKTWGVDVLTLRAGAVYKFAPDVSAYARLQFANTSYSDGRDYGSGFSSYTNVTKDVSRDHFTFSIPVGIDVKF